MYTYTVYLLMVGHFSKRLMIPLLSMLLPSAGLWAGLGNAKKVNTY